VSTPIPLYSIDAMDAPEIARLEAVIDQHCDALENERARWCLLCAIFFSAGGMLGAVVTVGWAVVKLWWS
jgi:hypothetical protein